MELNYLNIKHLYQLPCHVYWKDLQGIYQGANDFPAKMVGVKRGSELLGLSDFDVCFKESASKFRNNDQAVITQQKPVLSQKLF